LRPFLGLRLERVGLLADREGGVVVVAELGVLVERDLAVQCLELVAGQPRQRVDLDQGGVLLDEDVPELLDHLDRLVAQLGREASLVDDLGGLRGVDAGAGVDRDLLDRVGVGLGDLLDLHATLDAGDAEVLAVRAVQQEGEVVLVHDACAGGDQHAVDGEALDLHAQDVRGVLLGLVGGLGQLDTACLPSPAGLDLRLDHHDPELLGGCASLLGGAGHDAFGHRHAVLGEELLRLVLHQVHWSTKFLASSLSAWGASAPALGVLGTLVTSPRGREARGPQGERRHSWPEGRDRAGQSPWRVW